MNPSSRTPGLNSAQTVSTGDAADEDTSTILRSYWLMLLERKWYAITVFVLIILIATTYTFLVTPYYRAESMVQVLRRGSQVLRDADVVESTIATDTDFNTQIKVLESIAIIQAVVARLTPEELKQLTAKFPKRNGELPTPIEVIFQNRQIMTQRLTLMLAIQFRHPDPKLAARIANLFAEEYIAYNSRIRVEESMRAVDELKDRADQQRKRVDELATSLQAFRQRGNLISLVQTKDIVTERLKTLSLMATQTNSHLKEAEVRWKQVQDWVKADRNLTELPFIASQPKVSQLMIQLSTQAIAVAQMRQRYRDKHPRLIEAVNTLAQTEQEMKTALVIAADSVRSEYENAQQNDADARQALADQEAKSLDLDKSGVEYEHLNREYRVNEEILESMLLHMREASVTSSIETQSARIVDRATEPLKPYSPRIAINLSIGALAGIVFGFGFAGLVAVVDDRIKSTFDVETLIGLPLVGMIPHATKLDQPDKAQLVSNGADRMIVESFLSLYSTLRINDESRNARYILVTSTMPGEGKSFVSSNLALTFAAQGQRVVLVDCDLRKPNVHKSFRINMGAGVINYCAGSAKMEDIVVRSVHPNLDLVTAGGRAKNPVLILNSQEFENLVSDLGKRYDRVIFDTPPLGAVSDALNILPLVDGSIYTIQFNRVRRSVAKRCVKRLQSANLPIFGAILNDTDIQTADYYGEYDQKAYKEYFNLDSDEPVAEAPRTKGRFTVRA